ncbi:RNA-binding protein [Leptolyngbya sp. FACHB-261]|uniref:RNA recognition motif domain-containing protein n=1 Tax=Leptolyngbya sp. FACHB-261 TaxID=2692806 RepID=UPI001686F2F0|nr:RNA-binding protein [Leptolyngbya sp. FACHB-261]MBD2104148.1 RNA-binding protein [Leptolyngbya sp. FACHB-261]
MSIRLYVGNLAEDVDRQALENLFIQEGENISIKLITDRKTNKCRGFGFVTVNTDEQADQLIEKFNGMVFADQALRVEKAQPREKGKDEVAPPAAAPQASSSGSSGGGKRSGGGSANKSRRSSSGTAGTTSTPSEAAQPDPRWAQELERLKQMLATQTTNS